MSTPSVEKTKRITQKQRDFIASSQDDDDAYSSTDVAQWTERVENRWQKI